MKATRFKTAELLVEFLKKEGHTEVKIGMFDYDHCVLVRYKDGEEHREIVVQRMTHEKDGSTGCINNEEKILELINHRF